jgi:hypothetical protein
MKCAAQCVSEHLKAATKYDFVLLQSNQQIRYCVPDRCVFWIELLCVMRNKSTWLFHVHLIPIQDKRRGRGFGVRPSRTARFANSAYPLVKLLKQPQLELGSFVSSLLLKSIDVLFRYLPADHDGAEHNREYGCKDLRERKPHIRVMEPRAE